MHLSKNTCPTCGSEKSYSNKYDAYFCELCNVWLEEKCTDSGCEFCAIRPNKPSRLEMKKISEHEWIANIKRLERLFRESWVCSVYGYEFDAD
jgi:transcription initiation factor TFIIIB Brf1 subunit/transcription initiation factor TFIIB